MPTRQLALWPMILSPKQKYTDLQAGVQRSIRRRSSLLLNTVVIRAQVLDLGLYSDPHAVTYKLDDLLQAT